MQHVEAVVWFAAIFGFGPASIVLSYVLRNVVDSGPILLTGVIMTLFVDGTLVVAAGAYYLARWRRNGGHEPSGRYLSGSADYEPRGV